MDFIAARGEGGPGVLELSTGDRPEPAADEVLIKVAACGVNAPDIAQRRGRYDPPPGHSDIIGLEVAGIVENAGTGAGQWAAGDRVMALCNGGGYAEYVAVPAGQVLGVPEGWSLIEAACLPETCFTVVQTLVMRAGLRAGMAVVIHGAAGGLGGMAVQISRLYGARPIALVSSAEKADYANQLGASECIVHTEEDWVARVLALTDGHGAERILDMVGGEETNRNIEASAIGGHIVQVAALGGKVDRFNVGAMVVKQLTLSGSTLRGRTNETKAKIAEVLGGTVWNALANGQIVKPQIRPFALGDAAAAHELFETRTFFGKIALVTNYGVQTGWPSGQLGHQTGTSFTG